MYVYNDITTDARVQRAADALSSDFDLTLISTQKGKRIDDIGYKNILVGGSLHGEFGIMETILSAWRIIKKNRPDVVYCHDYFSAILAFILIHTRYAGKVVYDAHELIIPEKGQKDRRLRFFYWFEKNIVKKVDMLICASEQRGEIMKEHYGLASRPFVVPNISQLQVNDNDAEVQKLLLSQKDFFRDPKPTVVYAGVVTRSRCIIELFDAALALADKCKLLIVGNGDALEELKIKASKHPELHTAFTGSIPYKCLGSILSRCDIGFLYYPVDTLNNRYCASNKIFEYASVGLPMLSNENPTIKEELISNHIGIATSFFQQGLQQLLAFPKEYKLNCMSFMEKNCWERNMDLLNKAVNNL